MASFDSADHMPENKNIGKNADSTRISRGAVQMANDRDEIIRA